MVGPTFEVDMKVEGVRTQKGQGRKGNSFGSSDGGECVSMSESVLAMAKEGSAGGSSVTT